MLLFSTFLARISYVTNRQQCTDVYRAMVALLFACLEIHPSRKKKKHHKEVNDKTRTNYGTVPNHTRITSHQFTYTTVGTYSSTTVHRVVCAAAGSPVHFPPQDAAFPPPVVRLVCPENDQERYDGGQRSPSHRVQLKTPPQDTRVVHDSNHCSPANHQHQLGPRVRC